MEEGLRLSVGRLIADVVGKMDAAASRMTSLRMAFFSAHDTTILPLLLALQLPETKVALWPNFASSIVIELWAPTGAAADAGSECHRVRVLYNFQPLVLGTRGRAANGVCTLAEFRTLVSPYLPVDFAAECVAAVEAEEPIPAAPPLETEMAAKKK